MKGSLKGEFRVQGLELTFLKAWVLSSMFSLEVTFIEGWIESSRFRVYIPSRVDLEFKA